MSKQKPQPSPPPPWQVPVAVADIDEDGEHFDLVADDATRAAIARMAGLRDLPRFEARFDVTRSGAGGVHVGGLVLATVGQNCVVTLEPLSNEIEETVDLVFLPKQNGNGRDGESETQEREPKWDDPEPLVGDSIDLGALATEFLMLGLDPYPRKPGAVFEPPRQENADGGPFAALAALARDANRRDGS